MRRLALGHSASYVPANPNAGTLDGLDSAAFALLAGRAGGQVLQGGTAASETLTLVSTAHVTKGGVVLTGSHVILPGSIRPAADSTTALTLCKANGTAVVTVDTTNGNLILATSGDAMVFSTRKGSNSNGANIWIGGGGNVAVGSVGETYKGSYNSALGYLALNANTTGYYNSAFGSNALYLNTSGIGNAAVGLQALYANTTGGSNSAFGSSAGRFIADGTTGNETSGTSLYLGANSKALANGGANEIVIGFDATGAGSNTVTLGNTAITRTVLRGAQELTEIAAPGAGAANTARIYAVDNGAGKTQLMVQFATGTPIQLSIEA